MRVAAALALLLATPATAAPAMWVVRDADTEITLFGTIHALPKGVDWQSSAVKARIDAADTVVLEAIIPEDRFALAPMVAQMGIREGLKPLTARVGPEAAARIGPAAAAAGLPLAGLNRMKTWLAAITLSEAVYEQMGIDPDDGVEPALTVRAKAAGKPVIGLETTEQQLRYFDALSEADQSLLLTATLDDLKTAKPDIDRLIALWKAGDIETISRDFAKEAHASPNLDRILLTERNARWADWIARGMARRGKLFIAVGAAHFGGANGLLAGLKARGLAVERVQ